MAKAVKVTISSAQRRAFLHSPEVWAWVAEHGATVCARAGDGFEWDIKAGRARPHALVKTTDIPSRRRNAKDNTLVKALGGGKA